MWKKKEKKDVGWWGGGGGGGRILLHKFSYSCMHDVHVSIFSENVFPCSTQYFSC